MNASIRKVQKRPGILGFYKRKILFFALLVLMGWTSYSVLNSGRYKADETPIAPSANGSEITIDVGVDGQGSVTIDGKETNKKIQPFDDYDELRIPVVDQVGQSYDRVTINLHLPGKIAGRTKMEVLAIHGTGATRTFVVDSWTVAYQIDDVSPYATLSIVAKMPKGFVKIPLDQQAVKDVSNVKLNVWLAVGIGLPVLAFAFMVLFIFYRKRRQHIDVPEREVNAPPMAIPPALVGVLVNQRVRAREVAATLVDLAVRGDIVILDRERGFAFGKGKFDSRLLGYEKVLLSKIFRRNLSSDWAEIERRVNAHFYSKKISVVSAGIYAIATRLGYFNQNPQSTHLKYRFFGLLTFLVGLVGFLASLFYFTNPPFIAFFWAGMMVSSLVVAFAAASIPIRTVLGQEALSNWLAFKKYLSNTKQITYTPEIRDLFERYLPYAIVLDCEAAWAKRFADHNFTLPEWFLTDKNGLGLDDFCLSLFPIISYVSRSLVAIREPGFE